MDSQRHFKGETILLDTNPVKFQLLAHIWRIYVTDYRCCYVLTPVVEDLNVVMMN